MKKSVNLVLALIATPLVSLATGGTAEAAGRYFVNPKFPSEVQASHESFYLGKFDQMVQQIKTVLTKYPSDELLKKDVLALYETAYELKGNAAASPEYKLPEGVTWVAVGAKKRLRVGTGNIRNRFTISIDHKKGTEVEQIRVVSSPGRVLLDKAKSIGECEPDETGEELNLWCASDSQADRLPEGLYLFDLKLRGAETMHGWFIFTRMAATESPEVLSPTVDEETTNGMPTFRWKNFVSSEYRSYERRKVAASVSLDNSEGREVFKFYEYPAGEPPTSVSVTPALSPNAYLFKVSYRERHKFGPITISRESDSVVPFRVR